MDGSAAKRSKSECEKSPDDERADPRQLVCHDHKACDVREADEHWNTDTRLVASEDSVFLVMLARQYGIYVATTDVPNQGYVSFSSDIDKASPRPLWFPFQSAKQLAKRMRTRLQMPKLGNSTIAERAIAVCQHSFARAPPLSYSQFVLCIHQAGIPRAVFADFATGVVREVQSHEGFVGRDLGDETRLHLTGQPTHERSSFGALVRDLWAKLQGKNEGTLVVSWKVDLVLDHNAKQELLEQLKCCVFRDTESDRFWAAHYGSFLLLDANGLSLHGIQERSKPRVPQCQTAYWHFRCVLTEFIVSHRASLATLPAAAPLVPLPAAEPGVFPEHPKLKAFLRSVLVSNEAVVLRVSGGLGYDRSPLAEFLRDVVKAILRRANLVVSNRQGLWTGTEAEFAKLLDWRLRDVRVVLIEKCVSASPPVQRLQKLGLNAILEVPESTADVPGAHFPRHFWVEQRFGEVLRFLFSAIKA